MQTAPVEMHIKNIKSSKLHLSKLITALDNCTENAKNKKLQAFKHTNHS